MFWLIAPTTVPSRPSTFADAWEALLGWFWSTLAWLPIILVALGVVLLFILIAWGIRVIVYHITDRLHRRRNLALAMGRIAQAVVIILGILIAVVIAVPTIRFGDVVGFLGFTSIALGFAFKDVLQNFLAGLLLLISQPFRIGDQIVVKEFEGTVEDVQTRATFIRTYDGRRVVIPNSVLFTESVLVNTAFERRRWEYDIGIGTGDDIARAKQIIIDAARGVDGVLDDPPVEVLVVALADFSVKLRLWYWTEPPQRRNVFLVQDQVLHAVKNRLIEEGIDLPFPTHQVLFHDQTEETDGDRTRQREGWPAGHSPVPASRKIADAIAAGADGRPRGVDGALT